MTAAEVLETTRNGSDYPFLWRVAAETDAKRLRKLFDGLAGLSRPGEVWPCWPFAEVPGLTGGGRATVEEARQAVVAAFWLVAAHHGHAVDGSKMLRELVRLRDAFRERTALEVTSAARARCKHRVKAKKTGREGGRTRWEGRAETWARWQERAEKVWSVTPGLSTAEVARRIAGEAGELADTVARHLTPPNP
jgi:hypothetical protein